MSSIIHVHSYIQHARFSSSESMYGMHVYCRAHPPFLQPCLDTRIRHYADTSLYSVTCYSTRVATAGSYAYSETPRETRDRGPHSATRYRSKRFKWERGQKKFPRAMTHSAGPLNPGFALCGYVVLCPPKTYEVPPPM